MKDSEINWDMIQTLAIEAAIGAGGEILDIYNSDDFDISEKDDKSPLTRADKEAHIFISKILEKTNIPVLSEEGTDIPYEERSEWDYFWLVDPLDGTKEFIKRNDEFTVNIALIHNQKPVLGVVYVPVLKQLYFSSEKTGAFLSTGINADTNNIDLQLLITNSSKLPIISKRDTYTIVGSRSHMSSETEEFINKLKEKHNEINIISKGSSLKLCMVAEGKADIYPRFGPTMEWDTGAGHAIALGAGKNVTLTDNSSPLKYNKENLLNPWFIVS